MHRSVHRRCAVLWVSWYVGPAARGAGTKQGNISVSVSRPAFPPPASLCHFVSSGFWICLWSGSSEGTKGSVLCLSQSRAAVWLHRAWCDAHAHAASTADSSDAAR